MRDHGPRCGHSACSQHFIDTGSRRCVRGSLDDGARLGNALVGIAIALLGVCTVLGAGFLNLLETTR